MARRDGFREATGVGATIVHLIDIVETGNLAPGNPIQNIANLAKPALLILFLRSSRRWERDRETRFKPRWYGAQGQSVGWLTAMAAIGFGLGFEMRAPVISIFLGILVGGLLVWFSLRRLGDRSS